MKYMPTHTHSSLRTLLTKELPSLHAGLLVMGAIVATMMNMGVFALLFAAIITLDVASARSRSETWSEAIRDALRDVLLDSALFVVALTVAVYFRLPPPFVDRRGLRLMLWSLSVGGAIAVPKVILLLRFVRRILRPTRTVAAADRALSASEIFWLFVLTVSVLLLFLAPFVLSDGWNGMMLFLRSQIAFWRL